MLAAASRPSHEGINNGRQDPYNGLEEMMGLTKKLLSRIALAAAGALVLRVGATPAAYAGNVSEYVSVGGHNRGHITFIDDGDYFKVCDDYADGQGVVGILQMKVTDNGYRDLEAEIDGGDAGCDKFQHNVVNGVGYRLKICWKGRTTKYCDYDRFYE